MSHEYEIYKKVIAPEIKWIGSIIFPDSGNSIPVSPEIQDPLKLLEVIKQHRLYTIVHKLLTTQPNSDKSSILFPIKGSLKQLTYKNNLQMLQKASVLARVTSIMESNGIHVISLKGPVLSKILHNDFAFKASMDLDILIAEEQWHHAVKVLKNCGFVPTKCNFELNQTQIKYLKKHFHHLGFFHAGEKVNLELHWQLTTNKYLLNYDFGELYRKAVTIEVGNETVRTLDPVTTVVYLLVHGSHHAWARLDWLYEFVYTYKKYLELNSEILEECRRQELELLLCHAMSLSNIIFATDFEAGEYKNKKFMLKFCLGAINKAQVADFSKPVERINQKIYLSRLKKNIRYKAQVWLSLRTNMLDWNTIRLPSGLFFLYYFLRPFLVIYHRHKHI